MFAILYDDDHCVTYYAFITHKAVWHKMTTYIRYLIEAKRLSLLDAKRLYIYICLGTENEIVQSWNQS